MTYRMFINDEIRDRLSAFKQDKTLLIMGEGFDPRMNIGLQKLSECVNNLTVWRIRHSMEPIKIVTANSEIAKSNSKFFDELVEEKSIEHITLKLHMWDDGFPARFKGESEAAKLINIKKSELLHFDEIILDISALPRSAYFNFLMEICAVCNDTQRVSILVAENYNTDRNVIPRESEEKAHEVFKFDSGVDSLEDTITIWIPVLGESECETLRKERDYLIEKFGRIDEIFPVLPFPSMNVKRADNIIKEYRRELFSEWGVKKSNIIYVAECNPYQIARKLEDTVRKYRRLATIDTDSLNMECRFMFSAITSKLMRVGLLLALIRLRNDGLPAYLIDVANRNYAELSDKTAQTNSNNVLYYLPVFKGKVLG